MVAADRLRDAVNEWIAKAQSVKPEQIELQELKRKLELGAITVPIVGVPEKVELKGEQAEIRVPSVDLSVDTIVASISAPFNRKNIQDISGEIVQRDGRFSLTLRIREIGVIGVYNADPKDPDLLFTQAAGTILARTEPYIDGVILAGQGKSDEAKKQFREAIQINQNAAAAYNSIGALL
jgi:hypothetical protein